MIQVYKKNGLFIIEDTTIDVIYPNLTRDEAATMLKDKGRKVGDRLDYPITDFNPEEVFKYSSLDGNLDTIKYYKQKLEEKDKEIENLRFIQEQFIKLNNNIQNVFEIYDMQNCILICKEIREWCEQNEFEIENADQSSDSVVYTYKLFKKLDEIEKGDEQ